MKGKRVERLPKVRSVCIVSLYILMITVLSACGSSKGIEDNNITEGTKHIEEKSTNEDVTNVQKETESESRMSDAQYMEKVYEVYRPELIEDILYDEVALSEASGGTKYVGKYAYEILIPYNRYNFRTIPNQIKIQFIGTDFVYLIQRDDVDGSFDSSKENRDSDIYLTAGKGEITFEENKVLNFYRDEKLFEDIVMTIEKDFEDEGGWFSPESYNGVKQVIVHFPGFYKYTDKVKEFYTIYIQHNDMYGAYSVIVRDGKITYQPVVSTIGESQWKVSNLNEKLISYSKTIYR